MKRKPSKFKSLSDDYLELTQVILSLTPSVQIDGDKVHSLVFETTIRNKLDSPISLVRSTLKVDGEEFYSEPIKIQPKEFGCIKFRTFSGNRKEIVEQLKGRDNCSIQLIHTFGTMKSGPLMIQQPEEWSFPYIIYPPQESPVKPLPVEDEMMLIIHKYSDKINISGVYDLIEDDYPGLTLSTFKRKYLYPYLKNHLIAKRAAGKRPGRKGSVLFLTDDRGKNWVKKLINSHEEAVNFLKKLP